MNEPTKKLFLFSIFTIINSQQSVENEHTKHKEKWFDGSKREYTTTVITKKSGQRVLTLFTSDYNK